MEDLQRQWGIASIKIETWVKENVEKAKSMVAGEPRIRIDDDVRGAFENFVRAGLSCSNHPFIPNQI